MNGRKPDPARLRHAVLIAALLVTFLAQPVDATPSDAVLHLSKSAGPPSTHVTIHGSGFAPKEVVDTYLDGDLRESLKADEVGGFEQPFVIPRPAAPGSHEVSALGRDSGLSASAIFLVRTDWRQFQFDEDHRGENPFENVLSPGTVSGLKERWTVPVAEASWLNAPIVVDGTLYVGVPGEGLDAIDPDTGEILWRRPIPGGVNLHIASGDGLVFAIAGLFGGDLYALDAASGDIVWQVAEGSGFNAPTFSGGVVYVGNLNGFEYAYVAATGDLLWKSGAGIGLVHTTVVGPDRVIAIGSVIGAFDRATGHLLWRLNRTDIGTDIVMSDGLVFESTGKVAIAVDATDGHVVWVNQRVPGHGYQQSLAVSDGMVFVPHYDGVLAALDASDGGLVWANQVGEFSVTSPCVANGVVYVVVGGDVVGLDQATGDELWRATMSPPALQYVMSPIVVDGVIFVSDLDGALHSFAL